ncbi:hypothetical protein CANCADRAFT_4351 [Tortispora caseinolytica NRRL Y-17796]|uniref:Pentacotripeptide-repeat region of PRORP domain-containing protein n=1 Tax=Tortispora caseinolytica NRRL Y-17796 TaxID=767744 RepID=A0A1E4TDD3_9ASCO|nr:hypothetical protein CANCADRAFT_4351 [Tortispora caseinolytica NRRL Y-17796]
MFNGNAWLAFYDSTDSKKSEPVDPKVLQWVPELSLKDIYSVIEKRMKDSEDSQGVVGIDTAATKPTKLSGFLFLRKKEQPIRTPMWNRKGRNWPSPDAISKAAYADESRLLAILKWKAKDYSERQKHLESFQMAKDISDVETQNLADSFGLSAWKQYYLFNMAALESVDNKESATSETAKGPRSLFYNFLKSSKLFGLHSPSYQDQRSFVATPYQDPEGYLSQLAKMAYPLPDFTPERGDIWHTMFIISLRTIRTRLRTPREQAWDLETLQRFSHQLFRTSDDDSFRQLFDQYMSLPEPRPLHMKPRMFELFLSRLLGLDVVTPTWAQRILTVYKDMEYARLPLTPIERCSRIYYVAIARGWPVNTEGLEDAIREYNDYTVYVQSKNLHIVTTHDLQGEYRVENSVLPNPAFTGGTPILLGLALNAKNHELANFAASLIVGKHIWDGSALSGHGLGEKEAKTNLDRTSFALLCRHFADIGRPDVLRRLYSALLTQNDVVIDITIVNAYLAGLVRTGQIDEAESVLTNLENRAKEKGLRGGPDLSKALQRQIEYLLKLISAKRAINQMRPASDFAVIPSAERVVPVVPNHQTYLMFIMHYCRTGYYAKTRELVERMESAGVPVSVEVATVIIQGFNKRYGYHTDEWSTERLLTFCEAYKDQTMANLARQDQKKVVCVRKKWNVRHFQEKPYVTAKLAYEWLTALVRRGLQKESEEALGWLSAVYLADHHRPLEEERNIKGIIATMTDTK